MGISLFSRISDFVQVFDGGVFARRCDNAQRNADLVK
jgi:hypothetical protein